MNWVKRSISDKAKKMERTDKCIQSISTALGIDSRNIEQTVTLLEEGATVPFIARYRKEMTGSLDEVAVASIRDSLESYKELEKRKEAIRSSLEKRDLLDGPLQQKIVAAQTLTLLEDIYLPYKPKRRTRAMIAREKGVEPLAQIILNNGPYRKEAAQYLSVQHEITTIDEALAAARDIVAEIISENIDVRVYLRNIFQRQAVVSSRVVEKSKSEATKFRDYFDWQESAEKIAGHRILALFRGEHLKFLRLSIRPDSGKTIELLQKFYRGKQQNNSEFDKALEDAYTRLFAPSLENELRKELKDRADAEAIEVFSNNLRELLLAPPLGQKRVMALDPGFRTGAKLVCLDQQGTLLHRQTIYPTQGQNQAEQAGKTIRELVKKYGVEAIAVGNGTAGRETENFVRSLGLDASIHVTLVNEDGASIYSASEVARKEFPNEDITVRGAVSIGRRLQDPLAELVKIDPKSIGVGQYQHDVNQSALKKSLEETIIYCVNRVGVEVNSASVELLSYVAGLGETLAAAIVEHRQQNGVFMKRRQLLKVKRLGAKAFEQCAGFLRIRNGADPLDNTGVHPERYALIEKMAKDHGITLDDLLISDSARESIQLRNYCGEGLGMETLTDIIEELGRPGRDPREKYVQFQFDDTVHSMEDLREGMILPAIITNVTKFGAFADIGVKQDGLIHISQMAKRFIKDPAEVVKVREQVKVRVVEIDIARKRIALSLLL
jgi:uncharacterized protein